MADRLCLGGDVLPRTPEVIVQRGATTGPSTGSDLLLRKTWVRLVAWASFPMIPHSVLVFSELSGTGLHRMAPLRPSAACWSPSDRFSSKISEVTE